MSESKQNMFPRQVLVCRHVEKSDKHKEYKGASKAGLARANYLADFLLTPSPLFSKPDVIYAFNKKGSLLNRSYQAVTPLIKIGRYEASQVNTQFDNDRESTLQMIESVFSPANAGKNVLIVWEHKIIPFMIQQIGMRISKDAPVFQDFIVWNASATKGGDDRELYSMTIVIDTANKSLIGFSQSDNFSKDRSVLYPDESTPKLLYKM